MTPGRERGDNSRVTTTRAATTGAGPGVFVDHRLRAGPVALVSLAVLALGVAAYVDSLSTSAQRDAVQAGRGAVTASTGVVLVVAAAVILQARPRHRVGLVLAVLGAVWTADGLFESWSVLAYASGAPGVDFAVWFVWRFGAFLLFGLPVLLVLYPTGHLMPGRWGRVGVGVLVVAASLPTTLLLAPDSVILGEQPVTGVRTDFLAVPVSDALAVGVLTVSQLATLLALLAAFGLAYLRHRRADADERTQLRWLLWAGILAVLSVTTTVLTSLSGPLTQILLTGTVTLIAASVTIGIVWPDLGDVDALVAWTLTSAGVAAIVIGLDVAALGLASSLIGGRLDEREVTVFVLVLAVVVYGPLRSWVGGGVRRLLFGRRADRYDVVSGFAARLEATRSVGEQLPALAGAVASTFKVPFVQVEVFAPGGGTLSASYGTATAEVQEVDIAYTGERIGRVVLPVLGARSMLSRRDHGLLLDLVRQAAIAIRSSLLAEEVQESRERLVLGREDDRRRIRRDLHDGLGPALGGVAMRLDAAGNALDSDPERARDLVRLARTEVREALEDVRRLVHGLRPPALDDLGLVPAVEQQAERVRSELAVTVRASDLTGLPAAVEVAAFRIVSEALTNVVKHAAASHCLIVMDRQGSTVCLEVCDDGRGIAEEVSAGVGLLSLRERAEELGGRCEVTCPAGGGTTVRAWLPLGTLPPGGLPGATDGTANKTGNRMADGMAGER